MTRDELRAQYAELRKRASDFIMHDCFPIEDVPKMAALLRHMHELCTPAMALCLLDDAEAATKKPRRVKREPPSRTWWCEGCKSFVSGPHRCSGEVVKR